MSDEMAQLVLDEAKEKMAKALEHVRADFGSVRTGRATPALIEGLMIDYYGTATPLKSLASFNVPEARLLQVVPFDKSSMAAIEKAIGASDLGINPSNDGQVIRLAFPPLTEERRRDAVKHLAGVLEDHKTAIRNIRRDGNEHVKKAAKDKLISADDEKRASEEVQQLTDAEIRRIEDFFQAKEKEIMTV